MELTPGLPTRKMPPTPPERMPGWVFVIQLFWLLILIALFVLYHVCSAFRTALPHTLGGQIPVEVPWFGAAGGCLISLTGIADHNRDWLPRFNYWHPVRPLAGAVTGGIGCVLVLVLANLADKTKLRSDAEFFDAVAFLFGYAEAQFRTLVTRLADVILSPGDQPAPAPSGGEAPAETA